MQDQQLPDHDIIIKPKEGYVISLENINELKRKMIEYCVDTKVKVLITGFLIDPGPMKVWEGEGDANFFSNIVTNDGYKFTPKSLDSPVWRSVCKHGDWTYINSTPGDYRECKLCGYREPLKPKLPS